MFALALTAYVMVSKFSVRLFDILRIEMPNLQAIVLDLLIGEIKCVCREVVKNFRRMGLNGMKSETEIYQN